MIPALIEGELDAVANSLADDRAAAQAASRYWGLFDDPQAAAAFARDAKLGTLDRGRVAASLFTARSAKYGLSAPTAEQVDRKALREIIATAETAFPPAARDGDPFNPPFRACLGELDLADGNATSAFDRFRDAAERLGADRPVDRAKALTGQARAAFALGRTAEAAARRAEAAEREAAGRPDDGEVRRPFEEFNAGRGVMPWRGPRRPPPGVASRGAAAGLPWDGPPNPARRTPPATARCRRNCSTNCPPCPPS